MASDNLGELLALPPGGWNIVKIRKDDRLAKIERLLYGLNYQVWFGLYGPVDTDIGLQEILCALLSTEVIISGVVPSTPKEAIEAITNMILYEGDSDHGPRDLVKKRPEITALLGDVVSEIGLSDADIVCEFGLTQGHPAYPVFWDYSYDIHAKGQRWIFIGSSSD